MSDPSLTPRRNPPSEVDKALASESALRAMLRASSDAVLLVNPDGLVRRFNDQAVTLYGWSREEVLGKAFSLLIPPEETEQHQALLKRVLAGEIVRSLEAVHLRRDGSTVPVSLGGSPLAEDDGTIVGVTIFVRDITDIVSRREEAEAAERELRESNAQLIRAFNSPLLPQSIYDDNAHYVRVNDAFCELVGRSREWLLEHTVVDITHPDDASNVLADLQSAKLGQPIPPRIEKRYLHADGHPIWAEINLTQHVEANGRHEFIAHVRDITQSIADKRELDARQRRLDASQLAGKVGTWEVDLETRIGSWSRGQRRIHLLGPDDPVPGWPEFRNLIHPDDRENLAFPDNRDIFEITYRWILEPDNVRIIVDSSTWVADEREGHPGYRVGTSQDVTEEQAAATALTASEHRFRVAFDTSLVPTGVVNGAGRILQINDAGCTLFGQPRELVLGKGFEDFAHEDERAWLSALIGQMRGGKAERGETELRLVHADGYEIWVEASLAVMIAPSAGSLGEFIVQLRDITEQRQNVERLQYLADHDALTSVLNKRGFDHALETFVENTQRGGRAPLGALALIDLDHFKHHNDTYGHPHGDVILQGIATTLRERLRDDDIIARTGGDEFAIVLANVTADQAERVVADLVPRLAKAAAAISPDDNLPVTVSIGFADFSDRPDSATIIRRADASLYAAKAAGRNQWKRLPAE